MLCKQIDGHLTFSGDFDYVLKPELPTEPEAVVVEAMVVRKLLRDKASGSGWTGSVMNELNAKIRQLEIRLMDLAIDNIKLKESR